MDILDKHGRKCVVYNIPMAFPKKQMYYDQGKSGFPRALRKEISSFCNPLYIKFMVLKDWYLRITEVSA